MVFTKELVLEPMLVLIPEVVPVSILVVVKETNREEYELELRGAEGEVSAALVVVEAVGTAPVRLPCELSVAPT
jgi:hypothetical protein